MKPRAILHIGTMKTGTTSIQQVFDTRREDMLAQGAFYPTSPGRRAHELLTYAASGGQRGPRADDPFWGGRKPHVRLAQFRAEFAAEMKSIPAHVDRVIISDERFSFYLRTPEQIGALRAMLTPYFKDFTIVAYLRRQDSFLASRYAEQLRVGTVGEPDHRRDQADRLQDYDYVWLLDNWGSVFGAQSIKPRIYERGGKGGFDSVTDFIAACGLDLVVKPEDRGARANPSMNAAGQLVLREVGRVLQERMQSPGVGGSLWRHVSDAVTAALPGKGWLPTREEAAEFMQQFDSCNETIRERYFPERETLFADESAAFPVSVLPINDHERFEAACLSLLELATRTNRRETILERRIARLTKLAAAAKTADEHVKTETRAAKSA